MDAAESAEAETEAHPAADATPDAKRVPGALLAALSGPLGSPEAVLAAVLHAEMREVGFLLQQARVCARTGGRERSPFAALVCG